MMSHRTLAALIAIWAAITWGGRIGLLVGDETFVAKSRIAISLLAAAVAVVGLLLGGSWRKLAVGSYAAVTVAVWVTSVISVVGDPASSLAFKGVHLMLAAVSITLAGVAWGTVVRRSESEPGRPSEAPTPTGR
jgi:hypothetical protein